MTQAINGHCHFHAPLRSIEVVPHGGVNLEPVQHSDGQLTLERPTLTSLGAEVELPEVCDSKDVAIVVLEGKGHLTLNEKVVTLEPGMLVFIPAYMTHMLQTPTYLVFLLSRCEPDPATSESAWIFDL